MRGRKPKPTRIHIMNGNPSKKDLNTKEPQPKRGIPRCPSHLDAEAKREWKRVTQELDAVGLLTVADRPTLAAYCVAWSRWVAAEEQINEHGPVLGSKKEGGGEYQNPWLAIANKAMGQIKDFAALFGLDPADRSRLHVQPAGKEESDFEEFLGEAK